MPCQGKRTDSQEVHASTKSVTRHKAEQPVTASAATDTAGYAEKGGGYVTAVDNAASSVLWVRCQIAFQFQMATARGEP